MVKNEWSDSSSGSMNVTDLDWPRHERAWGKRRQSDGDGGGAGPSASANFAMRPRETYDNAVRRVHCAAPVGTIYLLRGILLIKPGFSVRLRLGSTTVDKETAWQAHSKHSTHRGHLLFKLVQSILQHMKFCFNLQIANNGK